VLCCVLEKEASTEQRKRVDVPAELNGEKQCVLCSALLWSCNIQRVDVCCVDVVLSGRASRDCVVLSSRLWTRSQCQNPSRVKWQFLFSDRGFGRLYEGWRD